MSNCAGPVLAVFFVFLTGCGGGQERRFLPTGVETVTQPGGVIQIIVTSRASAEAINKNMAAMKQTTSREAALNMLSAELKKSDYRNTRTNYRTVDLDFLENFEYCRITGEYSPAGFAPVTPPAADPAKPAERSAPSISEEAISVDRDLRNMRR